MPAPTQSCPRCGALIVPQLVRCRQCKAYLHGTRLEGFVFEHLLPAGLQHAPGTGAILLAIVLYYALMVFAAGPDSILGFSGFSLVQLGATHGPSILRGQHWRFLTSIFAHHDLLHLALNLASLVVVGQMVERVFDRKKMLLIYLTAGALSMVVSHLWYVYGPWGYPLVTSAGASGAVCGLIGAALVAGKRQGPEGRELYRAMLRWSAIMAIWGFAAPGINNAAHFGGWLFGGLLAAITPLGLAKSVAVNRALSLITLGASAVVLLSVVAMAQNLSGYPAALEADAEPRAMLGMVYAMGHDGPGNGQALAERNCHDAVAEGRPRGEQLHRCELHVRANPWALEGYRTLAELYRGAGAVREAEGLARVITRLEALPFGED